MASRSPPPHYQNYLTPLLHRRFLSSAVVVFTACYLEACLMTDKSRFLWALFPFSATGLRALVLFLASGTPVLILRVSQLRVSSGRGLSGLDIFSRYVGSFSTYAALSTYVISSTIFALVYICSSSSRDRLYLTVEGKSYERPRLNERCLYIGFFGIYNGVLQGISHLAGDRGKITLFSAEASMKEELGRNLSRASANVIHNVAFVTVTAIVAYVPFRVWIFSNTLLLVRQIYWLNRTAALSSFPVGPGMFIRTAWLGLMIHALSEVAHQTFDVLFSQPPYQSNKTISDKSADPNGTLLTGLRCTKAPLAQAMAFRELTFIAKTRPDRRGAIFQDVDRNPSMWQQILKECLAVVSEVEIPLSETKQLPLFGDQAIHVSTATGKKGPPLIRTSQDLVFLSSTLSKSRLLFGSVQSADGGFPHDILKKTIPTQTGIYFSHVQAKTASKIKRHALAFLGTDAGKPFRQTAQLKASRLIPRVDLQIDAILAITDLVCASLDEDEFGVVQQHVPSILQCFRVTLNALESFVEYPGVHWTDVDWHRNGPAPLHEPEMLKKELKVGMQKIVGSFEPYLDSVLLSEIKAQEL